MTVELLDIKQETADYPYPKECRHCHFCHGDWIFGYRYAECRHLAVDSHFCSIERMTKFDEINACGSTGKLWQPRKDTLWQRIVARLW